MFSWQKKERRKKPLFFLDFYKNSVMLFGIEITTKKYNIFRDGVETGEVTYPANADNSKWFGIQMWNEKTGFVKMAQIVTGDNIFWNIEEI